MYVSINWQALSRTMLLIVPDSQMKTNSNDLSYPIHWTVSSPKRWERFNPLLFSVWHFPFSTGIITMFCMKQFMLANEPQLCYGKQVSSSRILECLVLKREYVCTRSFYFACMLLHKYLFFSPHFFLPRKIRTCALDFRSESWWS